MKIAMTQRVDRGPLIRWSLTMAGVALTAWLVFPAFWSEDQGSRVRLREAEGAPAMPAKPEAWATEAEPTAEHTPAAGPAVWQLCGIGNVSNPTGTVQQVLLSALPPHLGAQAQADLRQQVLDQLRQGSARARVAALLLDRPAPESSDADRALWSDQITREALQSSDAVALRWAEAACVDSPHSRDCRRGIIQAQIRAEPENAAHWAAWGADDPTAANQAWQGLQHAQYWHEAPWSLTLTVRSALPEDAPGYLQQALLAEVMNTEDALPASAQDLVRGRCGDLRNKPTDSSADTPTACATAAHLLVTQSDSLSALVYGVELARQQAWPAATVNALRQDIRQWNSEGVRWQPDPMQPLSCTAFQGLSRFLGDMVGGNEIAALKAAMQRRRTASAANTATAMEAGGAALTP